MVHRSRPWFFRFLLFAVTLVLVLPPARANPLLLVDMANAEVLLAQEAGRPWYPASLVKLTTALVVFNAIKDGRLGLDSEVVISARALRVPPSRLGLRVDTVLSMRDALNLLIVKSANDIAIAIAEAVSGSVEEFVAEMNRTAQGMGMSATRFVNPNGLYDPAQVTSARDLAIVALAIRRNYPQYASIFATSVVRLNGENLRSYNRLLTRFAGTTGMKTGYICAAGMNQVATVERDGEEYLVVVLGASSERERAELAAQTLTKALAGQYAASGQRVANIRNDTGMAAKNMRPLLCGAQAKSYVAERRAAFPFGLQGHSSFLGDQIAPRLYNATVLGRSRDVPVPRARPLNAPVAPAVEQGPVAASPASLVMVAPLPRPRPAFRH